MRPEGWELRLAAVVERARTQPYKLGSHDCLLFACDAWEAVTGEPAPVQLRGAYRSKRQALALIAKHGKTLRAAVSAVTGLAEKHPFMARRGDLLLWTDAKGEHLGICIGAKGAVLADDGLTFRPLKDFDTAWSIG
jgi:hypothetical protein